MSNFFESSASSQVGREFTPAPETMETRFGTLEFPGGYPTDETVKRVYDELDLQRATQLYLDMYPALSSHGLMKGWVRDLGMRDSMQINVTADRLDSSALVLTGNTESLYAFAVFDLKKDGPMVFEVPPGVMGPLDDHNFLFVADIGPTGMDRGQGGKYLLLPPGYEGDVPDGVPGDVHHLGDRTAERDNVAFAQRAGQRRQAVGVARRADHHRRW